MVRSLVNSTKYWEKVKTELSQKTGKFIAEIITQRR